MALEKASNIPIVPQQQVLQSPRQGGENPTGTPVPALHSDDKVSLGRGDSAAAPIPHPRFWNHFIGLPKVFHYGGAAITAGTALVKGIVVAVKTGSLAQTVMGAVEYGLAVGAGVGCVGTVVALRNLRKAQLEKAVLEAKLADEQKELAALASEVNIEKSDIHHLDTEVKNEKKDIQDLKIFLQSVVDVLEERLAKEQNARKALETEIVLLKDRVKALENSRA